MTTKAISPKSKAKTQLTDVRKATKRLSELLSDSNSSSEEIHEAALVLERAGCFIRRNAGKL